MTRALPTAIVVSPLLAAIALSTGRAGADPYRLRADAYGYTQSPQSPVGFIALSGEDRTRNWVDAEAMAWAGSGASPADALVMMVRLHDPRNIGELRLGRQIINGGAIRPLHIDGADVHGRLPMSGTHLSVFGGVPVVRDFAYGKYDWATGGRVWQELGKDTTTGFSYVQQRETGRLAHEELGLDLASAPTRWFDLASHGAYDLLYPGVSEATASVAGRFGPVRPELYATHRSPSRLLPATSLFSALGDAPSDSYGAAVKWKMFPRLDVLPTVAARMQDGDAGVDATIRTTLRLDDLGAGALTFDIRRQGAGAEPWTGARLAGRVPLSAKFIASSELEIVAADTPHGKGVVWPWGLMALRWLPNKTWEAAGAVEAASTSQHAFELNALLRATYKWSGPR